MSISSVAPSANNSGAAALSDVGIGSGLNVDGIVSKLMEVDSLPLTQLNNEISSYQATLSDYAAVTSAMSTFQTAVQTLNTAAQSNAALSVTPSNTSVLTGTATSNASAGNYNINVTQLAQAQSLTTAGVASMTSAIGSGASTTISFQFGTIGSGITGSALSTSVASSGIAAGSLTINGTTISTGASTTSATQLAAQINLATGTTGVKATAQASNSGTVNFTPVTTGDGDSYTLQVGNTVVANVGADSSLSAADLDAALQSTGTGSVGAQLAADGVTFTGSAEAGTLQFSKADGSNLTLSQTLTNSSGNASGGVSGLNTSGTAQTYMGSVSLASSNAVTIGGSNPSAAGLTAGSSLNSGTYSNSSFTQNTALTGGSVTISSGNDTLQGIASAINNANLGVSASIINDGSGNPYRLVLTSSTTGANASMKISVQGDSTLSNLLTEDPGGTQDMTQSVAAQNTNLTVNGIPITSTNNTVSNAIQGVTLNVAQTGSTSLSVAQNTSNLVSAVNSFVSAYNAINSTLSSAVAYNASTQSGGPLVGDSGVETVQAGLRQILDTTVAGVSQNVNALAQVGITFQNDGSLAVNSTTLQNAVTSNPTGVAALFGTVGNATDSLVSYKSSTSSTKQGTYGVNITQVATQGTQTGSAAPASSVTITTGQNDSLSVDVDGINTQVTIPAGTYTSTSLSSEVQSLINSNSSISNQGSSVNIGANSSGALVATSQRYGSASVVNLTGDAAQTLFGANSTQATGLDVEGTIGGNPATGSGQVLTGMAGSPTAGLAVTIAGGSTGDRGTVTYSQGYGAQLNTLLTSYLGSSGPITNETNALNNNVTSLQSQATALNKTLAAQQANYLTEFEALDTTVASLNATQTYLTQELASLASNG